ncbi:hypothetical protein B0G81_2399 [Paraburkholderia sp. BL6665CI2N2]|uniref:hypothetical protein n=1 Tax=Paraburkholderia sp. BL6665CI2N2 TaxID=1938806 RepID=UPI001064E2E8|nr:hypothetical protein [Paraburkholderia sp. BL6665CI2N2]TDY22112.1 hypothetical protein B0G81_2399 [Paraburkholderia sp. BL6665CI2N2]
MNTTPAPESMLVEIPNSIDRLKKKAKMLKSQLDPAKTYGLARMQRAVGDCIGRNISNVFSGREPPTLVFPADIQVDDLRTFQRQREVAVIGRLFPEMTLLELEAYLSKWNLVYWGEPGSFSTGGIQSTASLPQHQYGRTAFASPQPRDDVLLLAADQLLELGVTELPAPTEIFMPPSIDLAMDKAMRLAEIVQFSTPALAYYVTARIFGFSDWEKFTDQFRLANRSRFDEELAPDALRRRTSWQAKFLQTLMKIDKLTSLEMLGAWKPTSQPPGARLSNVHVRRV